MPQFWEVTHARAQQTVAVWNNFNPSFTVGTLTLTDHQTNTDTLFQQAGDVETQQDVLDGATTDRDANVAFIHDMNVRAPKLISANFPKTHSLQKEVSDVHAVDLNSIAKEIKRARRLTSLWARANTERAAMTPALPDILVGTTTVADVVAAVDAHPGLLQQIEDQLAELNRKRSTLRATDRIVDAGNKEWFEAWSNFYAEGTPEHDALSQVETEGGTSAPTALEIDLLIQNGLNVDVTYVPDGGAHATALTLLWQIDGVDLDFVNSVAATVTGQTVGPFTTGQLINFKTLAENSAGETESTVQAVTIV